ncbi:MAG: DNA starvation/stationary phase protection protein [Tannerella sp.]|jgi:starvation-inducible DNA-binding protein|nr:DNA starvation/stationary phase protection protein [Tannerella sp.]
MNTKNQVGLEVTAIHPVIVRLNTLLADYQVFYTNLRGLHWNIRGDKFYELHGVYEEYYNELAEKVDEAAERIVMLGGVPSSSFSEYLKQTGVKEVSGVSDWREGGSHVIAALQYLIGTLRELHVEARQVGDQGTLSLTTHAIKSFEKKVWMLSAYLAQ